MDIAAKMYVATSVAKKIPCIGKDFEIALEKRFPKAFQLKLDNSLVIKAANLSDADCKVLIRTLENKGNISPNGEYFSVEGFWNDLVQDRRALGEIATVRLAKVLNVKVTDVTDVVICSSDYKDIMLMHRFGQHKVISLKKARQVLRKDHYRAIVNGWASYYGSLFNWL